MDKKQIYYDLGYSIRKTSNDEIEIRHSFLSGFYRGVFRFFIISFFIIAAFSDARIGEAPLSSIYQPIMLDIKWGFYPEEELQEKYNNHLKVYEDKEFIKLFKITDKPDTYEEHKSRYSWSIFETRMWLGVKFIVFLFVLFLFIYPTPRTLRLNRKHRVIYLQNWKGHSIVPVPDKGDPLSGILYDRFSIYMFGGKGDYSLFFKLDLDEGEATDGGLLGCYPSPNKNHNMHLIKAMRAYFTEENPEFMQYIHSCYRIP
ncbi:hypothetical protein [Rodentibacter caecimuris]|uniref:hypothetical protein n=1 Tax=Rodentibacter caecimuris TaxID=1796644 RepID=UPI001F3DB1FD|nr:hypothetical protein [Rodentibacter heylii]